jgi:hypothetical protein
MRPTPATLAKVRPRYNGPQAPSCWQSIPLKGLHSLKRGMSERILWATHRPAHDRSGMLHQRRMRSEFDAARSRYDWRHLMSAGHWISAKKGPGVPGPFDPNDEKLT